MSGELKESKNITDLETVLSQYPNVGVMEERIGDYFIIAEYGEDLESVKKQVNVFLSFNNETNLLNPYISHKIPSMDEYVYIEFPPEGAVYHGVEYGDIRDLLTLTKAGLEIMQAFKQLSDQERLELPYFYSRRVYDARHRVESSQRFQNCLERTLSAVKKELGEE